MNSDVFTGVCGRLAGRVAVGAALGVLMLAGTLSAAPISLGKWESPFWYVQSATHPAITIFPDSHGVSPFLPSAEWFSAAVFNGYDSTFADRLAIYTRSNHISPGFSGAAPYYSSALFFSAPPAGLSWQWDTASLTHGGGTDKFISVAVVNSVPAGQIDNYAYVSVGLHDPPFSVGFVGLLEDGGAPDTFGTVAMLLDEGTDELALGVSLVDDGFSGLTGARILRASDDQLILDLFGDGSWDESSGTGLIGSVGGIVFPNIFLGDLLAGNTYFELNSAALPGGAIAGLLQVVSLGAAIPEPATWTFIVLAFPFLGLTIRRRRRVR